MNANLAFQILQLVNTHNESSIEAIIRAKAYRDFIENRTGSKDDAPPVVVEHPVEPGTRRKRRTKAEMEASLVKYEDIQNAMVRLFEREFGMEAAQEILDGFNVKSTTELKPEQYRECLDRLQEALEGKPLV